jgi:hypothetical protein
MVVNYHGAFEFGRDLIFAEVDRFQHVRYHAVQAKYEESIGYKAADDLVQDARQAFRNPFKHPQNGTEERISSFYAANGGSISTQGREHYFNSLRHEFGANVQLFQGKDLAAIDRWASVQRSTDLGPKIAGLMAEIRFNRETAVYMRISVGQGTNPLERFRTAAFSQYQTIPFLEGILKSGDPSMHLKQCVFANDILDGLLKLIPKDNKERLRQRLVSELLPAFDVSSDDLESDLKAFAKTLGPILGVL